MDVEDVWSAKESLGGCFFLIIHLEMNLSVVTKSILWESTSIFIFLNKWRLFPKLVKVV